MLVRTYLYILLGLFFIIATESYAAGKANKIERDTTKNVTIRFEFRLNEVDSTYAANRKAIEGIDLLLTDSVNASHVDEVMLTSYVLPKGNVTFETWLASMRTATVRGFLKQRYQYLNKTVIHAHQVNDSVGIDKAIALDRDLNRVDIQISQHCPATVSATEEAIPATDIKALRVDEAPRMIDAECAVATETEVKTMGRKTVLAVKNNLLYDLALAPNLEIELAIGKRWSLNTEYKCPWWMNNSREFCYQLLSGGIEGRYWLGNRRHRTGLTGHFLGLYAEGGIYDFQFNGDGYHGKYYGASGLTYGYVKQIASHLALEFSLGVGYLTTEYRKYTPYKGDLIWTNSGRYNFIGPTKAKVSLVWLITTRR